MRKRAFCSSLHLTIPVHTPFIEQSCSLCLRQFPTSAAGKLLFLPLCCLRCKWTQQLTRKVTQIPHTCQGQVAHTHAHSCYSLLKRMYNVYGGRVK